ncbi:scavenger mRNA decapping enzyme [Rhizoctonia solani]|nr:scavenger mRNA decapping enzyme [Rhizoctonia solani]
MTINLDRLEQFILDHVLNEDPLSHSISILGTLPERDQEGKRIPAIVQVTKTPISSKEITSIRGVFGKLETIGQNDIYHWVLGWLGDKRSPDVKITIVENATEAHIRKFTRQSWTMVRESPQLYAEVVKPYIEGFPTSRLQWVYNILSHESEADRILFEDPSPTDGFIIVPDLKWDGTTMSTFYIQAIVHTRDIRSMRDIRKRHLPILRNIRKQAIKVAQDKYGLSGGQLRLFVHYQPSYYHFHVHIVTLELSGQANANVGMAHLLDDVIAMLELESDDLNEEQGIFARMTLTYNIGKQHGLHDALVERQVSLIE